jgi:hypothetical protein
MVDFAGTPDTHTWVKFPAILGARHGNGNIMPPPSILLRPVLPLMPPDMS